MATDEMSGFAEEPGFSVPRETTRHEGDAEVDAVRSYFNQVGRVPLRKPHEERALCQRIEAARSAVAAALLAVPAAARQLTELSTVVRNGITVSDSVLLSPDGRPLKRHEIAAALDRLALAVRQGAALMRVDAALGRPRGGKSRRLELQRRGERLMEAVDTVALVPLHPAVRVSAS